MENHTIMIGPNQRPMTAVPLRWKVNSSTMITAVTGMMNVSRSGLIVLTPSTAESTEIAGVIMLSPRKSAAPKMPRAASVNVALRPRPAPWRRIRVMRAMMPPSPSLSARMANPT